MYQLGIPPRNHKNSVKIRELDTSFWLVLEKLYFCTSAKVIGLKYLIASSEGEEEKRKEQVAGRGQEREGRNEGRK